MLHTDQLIEIATELAMDAKDNLADLQRKLSAIETAKVEIEAARRQHQDLRDYRPCNSATAALDDSRRVTPLLGRRTVARAGQPARIVVQPVGRAHRAPLHDLLLNPHDFDRLTR